MYHLKAHIISNKLVSKVFAQKKGGGGGGGGGGSYDTQICVRFRWFLVESPLKMMMLR